MNNHDDRLKILSNFSLFYAEKLAKGEHAFATSGDFSLLKVHSAEEKTVLFVHNNPL